jgi:hypothetical protein
MMRAGIVALVNAMPNADQAEIIVLILRTLYAKRDAMQSVMRSIVSRWRYGFAGEPPPLKR